MRVRCGACRTQFDVPGAGRYTCPVCGSVNSVRDANGDEGGDTVGGYQAAPGVAPEGAGAPPPPPPPPPPQPDAPMPKIECPECGFTFIIGMIAVASCPNCLAEVPTGIVEDEDE